MNTIDGLNFFPREFFDEAYLMEEAEVSASASAIAPTERRYLSQKLLDLKHMEHATLPLREGEGQVAVFDG